MAAGAVENVPRRRLALEDGALRRHVRRRPRARLRRAEGVRRRRRDGGVRRAASSSSQGGTLAAVIEADTARPAAHGCRERRRREAPRAHRRAQPRRDRLRLAGGGPGRGDPGGGADARARRRLLPDAGAAARVLQAVGAEPGESHARRRASRTSSSRRRPRAIPCCAASGCARARSSARWARTGPARASSTTSCSSARRSSAATRSSRRKLESGDLIEPVESGVLDWLEVHELQEVVAGELPAGSGRRHRRLQVERDRCLGRRDRRRRARARA